MQTWEERWFAEVEKEKLRQKTDSDCEWKQVQTQPVSENKQYLYVYKTEKLSRLPCDVIIYLIYFLCEKKTTQIRLAYMTSHFNECILQWFHTEHWRITIYIPKITAITDFHMWPKLDSHPYCPTWEYYGALLLSPLYFTCAIQGLWLSEE